jgi:alpha-ribazole phosphatase
MPNVTAGSNMFCIMKVFLIRHTPTVAPKGVIYGRSDLDIREPWEPMFHEIMGFLSEERGSNGIWPPDKSQIESARDNSTASGAQSDAISVDSPVTLGSLIEKTESQSYESDSDTQPEQNNTVATQNQKHIYFSSPLIRCKKMAKYMARKFIEPTSPIVYDDRLMEIDFGAWEMGRWADIPRDEIDHWMADFVNLAPPGGESFAEVYHRSIAFWKQNIEPLLEEPLNVLPGEVSTARVKTVAAQEPIVYIFGHGGVLRAFLCYILGMEMKDAFKMILRHGSVTEIELNKDTRRTRLIHLSRGGEPYSF